MNCTRAICSLVKEKINNPEEIRDEKRFLSFIADKVGSDKPEKIFYLKRCLLSTGKNSFIYFIVVALPSEMHFLLVKDSFGVLQREESLPYFNSVIFALGAKPPLCFKRIFSIKESIHSKATHSTIPKTKRDRSTKLLISKKENIQTKKKVSLKDNVSLAIEYTIKHGIIQCVSSLKEPPYDVGGIIKETMAIMDQKIFDTFPIRDMRVFQRMKGKSDPKKACKIARERIQI
jgi:hypothetical protein